MVFSCSEEEMEYIDPMIDGIRTSVENAVNVLNNSGSWSGALIGFRDQRNKLVEMKTFMDADGYSGDGYTLEDEVLAAQRIDSTLNFVNFKLDSLWNVSIKAPFEALNVNSAGIKNFGTKAYSAAELKSAEISTWLGTTVDDEQVVAFTTTDLVELKASIDALAFLSALNDQEVVQFVQDLNDKYAEMQQQYADLETEVNTSPYFSKAQKELYTALGQPLIDFQTTLDENLSLDTKDQLDLIDSDLSPLVYFVENNYTSPAIKPKVYGEVANICELRWLSEEAVGDDWADGVTWVLTADIDAAETRRWNEGTGWLAIGGSGDSFYGVFDGQFHIISGLYINQPAGYKCGLIGNCWGDIKNLGLVNVNMNLTSPYGGSFAGILLGDMTNCFATGWVGLRGNCGGLVGRTQGDAGTAIMTNCFSLVDCEYMAAGNSGGISGYSMGTATFNNCYTVGRVYNRASGSNTNAVIGGLHGTATYEGTINGLYWSSELCEFPTATQKADFDAAMVDLPAASWSDLANFPTFSADEWEIRSVPELVDSPRPYLKGFNYDGIKDFITVE
jgi:hypothetical protein